MNIPTRPRIPCAALLLGWLLSSCSVLEPEDPQVIRITNETSTALHIQAWEMEASYVVDPAPSFALDPSSDPVLLPGEALKLYPEEIHGPYEPGKDLALFIFEVQENTAFYQSVQQVRAGTLRKRDGRILITGF